MSQRVVRLKPRQYPNTCLSEGIYLNGRGVFTDQYKDDHKSQQWNYDDVTGSLENAGCGLCLEDRGDEKPLTLQKCDKTNQLQGWDINNGKLINKKTSRALVIDNDAFEGYPNVISRSKENGTLFDIDTVKGQKNRLSPQGCGDDKRYEILYIKSRNACIILTTFVVLFASLAIGGFGVSIYIIIKEFKKNTYKRIK